MKSISIEINTNKIPKSVGYISKYNGNQSLYIISMTEFKKWVQSKIHQENETIKIIYVISGAMPNCAALQIGLLLSGHGTVVFKTTRDFVREMVVD